jgi:DNA topoisomerase I
MYSDLKGASLEFTKPKHLKIRRVRRGKGFTYVRSDGSHIRERTTIRRLERLAVPPAYRETLFATNPRAHIQAVGRDAAGRLQYRYHPEWERIRELRKARRLAKLIDLMPAMRRKVAKLLKEKQISQAVAAATLVDLIACTAIRSGSETYAREHGTRGAATLLKRHVRIDGDQIVLSFPGKGGKRVQKQCSSRRLSKILRRLQRIPGNRLFQYIADNGAVQPLRRRDANAFLRKISTDKVSLKDFRTLSACSHALEHLAGVDPKPSERGKRAQIKSALRQVANELVNTPAVCKRSYVHALVIEAFENGHLKKLPLSCATNSRNKGHRLLQRILRDASATRMRESISPAGGSVFSG